MFLSHQIQIMFLVKLNTYTMFSVPINCYFTKLHSAVKCRKITRTTLKENSRAECKEQPAIFLRFKQEILRINLNTSP